MYTIIDEYKSENATMRKMLATKDKALATKDKALQKALAENEKLRRQFGINSQIIETDN